LKLLESICSRKKCLGGGEIQSSRQVREKVFVLGRGNNEKTEESEEEKNALLKIHEIKDADGKRKREWKNNGYMYSIMK
jgi:hypothetical protein